MYRVEGGSNPRPFSAARLPPRTRSSALSKFADGQRRPRGAAWLTSNPRFLSLNRKLRERRRLSNDSTTHGRPRPVFNRGADCTRRPPPPPPPRARASNEGKGHHEEPTSSIPDLGELYLFLFLFFSLLPLFFPSILRLYFIG